MSKLTVTCIAWKPIERNTLKGFAGFRIDAMRLTIAECAVHEKDGRRWVQLPAKPQIGADRELVKDAVGKVQYTPVLRFDSRAVGDAFSDAALAALDRYRGATEPTTFWAGST